MKYNHYLEESENIMVSKKERRIILVRDIVVFSIIAIFLLIYMIGTSIDARAVNGISMQPTINSTQTDANHYDIVLVNDSKNIKRGDIIIINASKYLKSTQYIIKRVIAIEGDTINITWDSLNQKLVVTLTKSGSSTPEILQENYIKKDANDPTKDDSFAEYCASTFYSKNSFYDTKATWIDKENYTNQDGSITIPEGYFFALGDNRGNSTDCSELGPIETSNIVGIVYKILPDGTFFNWFFKSIFGIQLSTSSKRN